MKKLLAAALLFCVLAGCARTPYAFKREDRVYVADEEHLHFKIGVAVGEADALDDNTFNAMAWNGVIQYINRYPRVKVQRSVPRKSEPEEMEGVIDELLDIGCEVILGFGQEYAKIFAKAIPEHPEVTFILFSGGEIEAEGDNFVAIDFEDQQSAFLGGVAAALNSETGKIGFVGAKPDESINRQSLGFKAGIGYANANFGTDARLEPLEFADSYDDIAKGRALAKDLYRSEVDVIFACARITGKGVMEEAMVLSEQGWDIWVVGVDNDLYDDGKGPDDKSVVLTSVIKKMDVVIYEILEDYGRNRFPQDKYQRRTLVDQGLGLPDTNRNFNEKTKVLIAQTEELIKDGTLEIPFGLEELEAYADSFF